MLSSWVRLTNDIKIRNKLIVSFVVVVLIPVLIVGLFLTVELRKMALHNAVKQMENNVERVAKRTADIVHVPADISYRLLYDNRFNALVNTRYDATLAVVEAYRNYRDFQEYERLYKEVSGLRFYMNNPTLLNNWEFFQPDQVKDTAWYRDAVRGKGLIGWYYIEDERDRRPYLSLVRRIDFLNHRTYGVLVVNVNTAYLNEVLQQEPFETMIVDANHYIVASNRQDILGRTLEQIDFNPEAAMRQDGMLQAVIGGEASKIIVEPLRPEVSMNGLRIVSVFAIRDIVRDANRTILLSSIVIASSLLIALLLIYGFSVLLSNRLLRLSNHINQVSTGNLNAVLQIDGKDEVGQLSRKFNSMVSSIKALMQEVEQTHFQKNQLLVKQNQIKFKMMASQINPHFLFNALEAIRMKAHLKGDREIAQVVRQLGRMMRKNLEAGSENIPLNSEMEMVRCYLEIQKFRYGDRLNYEIRVDPQVRSIPVPPLIVQPLVENAIIHGLEDKETCGTVAVQADEIDGELCIRVTDDGVGMSGDRLEAIQAGLAADEGEPGRIGLRNVHQRLRLIRGSGLILASRPGAGTSVEFKIPIGGERDVPCDDCG